MKYLAAILLALSAMNGLAQTWAPFPLDQAAQWEIQKGALTNGCWVTHNLIYHIAGEVEFNGKIYSQIDYTGTYWSQTAESSHPSCNIWPPLPTSGTRGYLRAEDGIYYQGWPNGEEILYDFTREVGDTIIGPTGGLVYLIDSIDVVNIDGIDCKRLWFVSNEGPQTLVEGIGSTHGIFEAMFFFEFYNSLVCYGEDFIPLYPQGSACDFIVGLEHESEEELSAFPNPSTGIFNLDLQQQFSYQVFDLFGKLVDEGISSGQTVIDLTSQPNGIYLLKADTEKGSFAKKLVKQ